MFDEMLARVKEKVAKEEKRKRRAREDFTALLKESRDIKLDMSWEDAQPLLEKQPEYKAVSHFSMNTGRISASTLRACLLTFCMYDVMTERAQALLACCASWSLNLLLQVIILAVWVASEIPPSAVSLARRIQSQPGLVFMCLE